MEEIKQLLVIDLKEGAVDCEAEVWLSMAHRLKITEDLVNGLGYDTELILILEEVLSIAQLPHGVLVTEVIVPVGPEHGVSLS